MGFKTTTALLMLGLMAGGAVQAADDCDANQASMNACAGKALSKADADLNTYYKAQVAYLKTPAKQQAFKDAQRKWLAFRDADCLYRNGKPEDSGSIWPLLNAQCKAELTRQRADQLKVFSQCRSDDCPR